MSWVGQRLRRFEDPAHIRGEAAFVGDLAIGAKTLRFVRSPVARGRILEISAPTRVEVITGHQLQGVGAIRPLLHRDDFFVVDQPVLPTEEVVFAGQAVAAVLASNPHEAEDLADQVFLDIEPSDPVTDMDQAIDPDSPKVHEHVPSNTLLDARFSSAGFDDTFQSAPHRINIETRTHRQSAMPLEARGGVATLDRRTGRVTLTTATQMPHVMRTAIADVLRMRESDLRVIAPDVGGGFGQKMNLAIEDIVAVWAAREMGGSVAWVEDRRENFTSSFHSRDHRYLVEGGFDENGRLLAIRADIRCNVGAFSCYPVTCGVEPLMALAEFPGPYDFQEYSVRARAVATNACPIGPYRGVARPAITLTLERLMDTAAAQLGMDPIEIRRRNLIRKFPYRSVTGLTYDEGSYVEALDTAVAAADISTFKNRQAQALTEGRYLGIGFSTFSERTGYGTPAFAGRSMDVTPGFETVDLSMDPSGNVDVRVGTSPHGQGLETSLAQVIADELGVTPDKVRVIHGDTDSTPYGWGTFGSRSMVLSGGASKIAATELKNKLLAIAGEQLEVAAEDLEFIEGDIKVKGTNLGLGISQVARLAHHGSHRMPEGLGPALRTSATYDPLGTFSNACHVALVEVDIDTGHVAIERFIVAEDAGIVVNPQIADGQIHGGVAQGIAGALFEELVYDADGNLLTTSLMDYLPPTMAEVPNIEIIHLETRSDATITGAKGLGEGGTIGAPAAILNAITDALSPLGIQVNEMPATPSRIRSLIRAAEESS